MQIPLARLFSRGAPAEPTFGSVADEWLDSTGTNIKHSTRSVYSTVAAKYIPSWLQVKPVSRVTAGDIQQLLYEAEHPPGREPLSASRMRTICTVINAILSFARDKGLDAAAHYQPRRSPGAAGPEVNPLTKDEQTALESWLLDNMGESSLGVLICLYTGLRLGEICAMKWGDISFADRTLRVRRTVQRIKAAEAGPGQPKTCLVFDSPKKRACEPHGAHTGHSPEADGAAAGSRRGLYPDRQRGTLYRPEDLSKQVLRNAPARRRAQGEIPYPEAHLCHELRQAGLRPQNALRYIRALRREHHA